MTSMCLSLIATDWRAVDLLDLVDQVALQLLVAQDREHVVRVDGTVDERIARANALAFLHVDVRVAGDEVLAASRPSSP